MSTKFRSSAAKSVALLSWYLLHRQVVARGNLTGAMDIEGQRGRHFWF